MKKLLTLLIALLIVGSALSQVVLFGPRRTVEAAPAVDSPDDISGLFFWYEGDEAVTNSSGALASADELVSWWGDKSGNGRHLRTNNVHGVNPIYKTAAQTGKSIGGLQFAGTTNQLKVGFTAQADMTIFVAWRTASSGSYKIFLDSTNASARQVMYKRNTDLFTISSVTEQTVAGAIPNPSWNIMCAVFNSGGNDSIYTNGVVASTSLVAGNQSLDGLTIGGAYDGTNPLGNAEYLPTIIGYNRLLNSTEIGQVFTFINGRLSVY